MLRDNISKESLFLVIVGAISIFYPFYLFFLNTFKACFSKSDVAEQHMLIDYDDMRIRFLNEYDRTNPLTKEEALHEYFDFIKSKFYVKNRQINWRCLNDDVPE